MGSSPTGGDPFFVLYYLLQTFRMRMQVFDMRGDTIGRVYNSTVTVNSKDTIIPFGEGRGGGGGGGEST